MPDVHPESALPLNIGMQFTRENLINYCYRATFFIRHSYAYFIIDKTNIIFEYYCTDWTFDTNVTDTMEKSKIGK